MVLVQQQVAQLQELPDEALRQLAELTEWPLDAIAGKRLPAIPPCCIPSHSGLEC
jgi:hypothetical protein